MRALSGGMMTKQQVRADAAKVANAHRGWDSVMASGMTQEEVETLTRWAGPPVYTDTGKLWWPTHRVADLLLVRVADGSVRTRAEVCRKDWVES